MFTERAIDNFFLDVGKSRKVFGSDEYLKALNTTLNSANKDNQSFDLQIPCFNTLFHYFDSIFNTVYLELKELKNQKIKILRNIELMDEETFIQIDIDAKFDYLKSIIIEKCLDNHFCNNMTDSFFNKAKIYSNRPITDDIKIFKTLFVKMVKDKRKFIKSKKVQATKNSSTQVSDLFPHTSRLLNITLIDTKSKNLAVLNSLSMKHSNLETYFGVGLFFLQHTLKENESPSDPHLLELVQNAPPFANAYINSTQYSQHVTYLKINALHRHEDSVKYPFHFLNIDLMDANQQVIEEFHGTSHGRRYNFCILENPENQPIDTDCEFIFIGETLQELYPTFLPPLFKTKCFTPTKEHAYNQQELLDLLPSEMYSSRPLRSDYDLEIDLDNVLYDHPLFSKHQGTRTYDLFVDSTPEGLEWYLQNPNSSREIQEAKLLLNDIKTAYSCMFVDKSNHFDTIDCFINEIINHRKNMKVQEIKPLEVNGIEHKCSLLCFYDIDLNFKVFSKNLNHSRQVTAIIGYIYLLIKELRPKCYKTT